MVFRAVSFGKIDNFISALNIKIITPRCSVQYYCMGGIWGVGETDLSLTDPHHSPPRMIPVVKNRLVHIFLN